MVNAIRDRLQASHRWPSEMSDDEVIAAYIAKVEVRSWHLAIHIKTPAVGISTSKTEPVDQQNADQDHRQPELILIPWSSRPKNSARLSSQQLPRIGSSQ
jgi:hypothetical protein